MRTFEKKWARYEKTKGNDREATRIIWGSLHPGVDEGTFIQAYIEQNKTLKDSSKP